ncbi:MAG: UxaA family hydrolase [Candidatus Ornithospirochaeta sp.]
MAQKLIRITDRDNVAVALESLPQGTVVEVDGITMTIGSNVPAGHKVALFPIGEGEPVVKYGYPIGKAKTEIKKGEWVHTFNVKTALSEEAEYSYSEEEAKECLLEMAEKKAVYASSGIPTIKAYERKNGDIGIRNALWIVPTVGCVNQISKTLEAWGNENLGLEDGVSAWTHPFGCSQLGEDHENTRLILSDLVHHPNAGGVLVVGLGCENNTMESFKALVGDVDGDRVKFMVCQEEEDELESGKKLLEEIALVMKGDKRTTVPMSKLVVGMKCGGSDGFSGITGNPLVGRFTNELVAMGGTAILTEVPEMFGAEQVLMNRAENKEVFESVVDMINGFKHYFTSHGQVVYENPSPGNKMGGITTLEDKSLGCVQKGGRAPVSGVLKYGERVERKGMNLLTGPGNDIVSTTVQSAAGAHMILFTTGRGTPLGSPVPTVKIATNTALSEKKANWIDFNAGRLLNEDAEKVLDDFMVLIQRIASGEVKTKNEINGYSEISILKDGVVL